MNQEIAKVLGPSHQLRVGTEIRVTPELSLRAGYNLITTEEDEMTLRKHSFSAGFGISRGSMFVDAAVRARFMPKEYYIPYAVDVIVKGGQARCEVLSTPSKWFGVTYKDDRPGVVAKFQELVDKGVYPTPLYK